MSVRALLADYRTKHADPLNLRLHVATVPLGAFGLLSLFAAVPLPWPGTNAAQPIAAGVAVAMLVSDLAAGALALPALAALTFAATAIARSGPAWAVAVGLAAFVMAVAAQGAGHRREAVQAAFAGPGDLLFRLLREQLLLSPLFLVRRALGGAAGTKETGRG